MLIGAKTVAAFVLEIATSLSLLAMTRLFVTALLNDYLLPQNILPQKRAKSLTKPAFSYICILVFL